MKRYLIPGIIGLTAAYFGLRSYMGSGSLLLGLTMLVLASIIFFAARSPEALWNSITLIQNPFIFTFLVLTGGLYYASLSGLGFASSLTFSTGAAFIGLAFGFLVYGYWNIR